MSTLEIVSWGFSIWYVGALITAAALGQSEKSQPAPYHPLLKTILVGVWVIPLIVQPIVLVYRLAKRQKPQGETVGKGRR